MMVAEWNNDDDDGDAQFCCSHAVEIMTKAVVFSAPVSVNTSIARKKTAKRSAFPPDDGRLLLRGHSQNRNNASATMLPVRADRKDGHLNYFSSNFQRHRRALNDELSSGANISLRRSSDDEIIALVLPTNSPDGATAASDAR